MGVKRAVALLATAASAISADVAPCYRAVGAFHIATSPIDAGFRWKKCFIATNERRWN